VYTPDISHNNLR